MFVSLSCSFQLSISLATGAKRGSCFSADPYHPCPGPPGATTAAAATLCEVSRRCRRSGTNRPHLESTSLHPSRALSGRPRRLRSHVSEHPHCLSSRPTRHHRMSVAHPNGKRDPGPGVPRPEPTWEWQAGNPPYCHPRQSTDAVIPREVTLSIGSYHTLMICCRANRASFRRAMHGDCSGKRAH